jgi:hypothetical protein
VPDVALTAALKAVAEDAYRAAAAADAWGASSAEWADACACIRRLNVNGGG